MERLYSSGCRSYADDAQGKCLIMAKVGSFVGTQGFCFLLILCSLLHRYVFSTSRLNLLYGPKYAALPLQEKQHLRLVHVGIVMKSMAAPIMLISIFMVIHGGYTWSDSFGPCVTVFDTVSLSTCLLGASALFDMIYDEGLRPLYVWHHLVMLLAIQGTLALIMSLTTSNEARLLATFEAIKVGLTWVLFSSLGSTLSRLTYLLRKLFSFEPKTLCRMFLVNFITFASVTFLEAATVAYLLRTRWGQLPTLLAIVIALFQALFTTTKYKTVGRLFAVYRNQAMDVKTLLDVTKWEKGKNIK